MKTVELKTAHHWHCEECSRENFALPMCKEMGDGEKEAHCRYFYGLESWEPLPKDWDQFECLYIPERVTCIACKETFLTADERMGGWPVE